MTGTEIQSYVESRLGRTFSPDDILLAINECLDEIGDLGLLYATIDISVDDGAQWYSLPDDFSKVKKVIQYEDDREYVYENWKYRNGSIRIPDEGDYHIISRKMPEYLTNIANNINNIHRLYNNAIKYYVLAWVRENEDLDDETSKVLFKRFNQKLKRAANTLISSKAPSRWTVVRNG